MKIGKQYAEVSVATAKRIELEINKVLKKHGASFKSSPWSGLKLHGKYHPFILEMKNVNYSDVPELEFATKEDSDSLDNKKRSETYQRQRKDGFIKS